MLHRNKFSNKIFIGLMSLGFAGAIVAAPIASNANSTSGSTSGSMGGATSQSTPSQGSGYPQSPSDLPVTNPEPQGAERDTAPITPADAIENNQDGSTPSTRSNMGTGSNSCPSGSSTGSSSMGTGSTTRPNMSQANPGSAASGSMQSESSMGVGSSTGSTAATNLSCNVPTNGSSGFDSSGATPNPVR